MVTAGRPLKPLKRMSKGTKDKKFDLYPRERQVFKRIIDNNETLEEAVEQVYDTNSPGSTRALARRLTNRDRFIAALEAAGVSDDIMATTYAQGLKAKRPVVTKDGVFQYPDWQARHQFVKTASRIKGHFQEDTEDGQLEPLIVNLVQFKGNTINVKK